MASQAILELEFSISDAQGIHQNQHERCRFTPAQALVNGKRETLVLTASIFTALTVPTGAKLLIIILNGATSITLKGITGDTGLTIAPSASPITGLDAVIPLGATPSIGLLNGVASDQNVELIWG